MKTASRFFSNTQIQMIETAISEAEKSTSGEIIPVVATVSGRYDRAEDIFGLLFAVISLAVCWVLFQEMVPVEEQWSQGVTIQLSLLPIIAIVILGFFAGTILATFFPSLRLIFIAKKEMQEEVERSAAEAFHRFRVHQTQAATGILIYVSLYEHMVTVIGDSSINEAIKQIDWEEICTLTVQGIKKGTPAEGLIGSIEQSGKLLAEYFPILPDDENELSNELRLID